jgi:uncharacterized protein YjcR
MKSINQIEKRISEIDEGIADAEAKKEIKSEKNEKKNISI